MNNDVLGKLNGTYPLYQAIEAKIDKHNETISSKIDASDKRVLQLVTSIDTAVATLRIIIPFGFACLVILAGLVGIKLTGVHF